MEKEGRGRCAALVVEGGEVREGRRVEWRRRDADAALVVEGEGEWWDG